MNVTRSKQSNGKIKKRMISAWYKQDFKLWLIQLVSLGYLEPHGPELYTSQYKNWSCAWSNRSDIDAFVDPYKPPELTDSDYSDEWSPAFYRAPQQVIRNPGYACVKVTIV